MAWTAPNTYIAGAILTAAQLNAMQANALAGGPIYATYADLIAAIPSPFEGQRAYITAPAVGTVTAAGGTTAVPTGINVVYNGTVWVCTTPVSANTDNTGTTTTGTFTTTLAGSPGTNPSVTLLTGTTALIGFAATTATATLGQGAFITVGVASGADTGRAGNDVASPITVGRSTVITGLTAGVNTLTLYYKASGGITATFSYRSLTAQGIA